MNKQANEICCLLVTKTQMWGCEVRSANSHNTTAHYPGWQTQQQQSLTSQSEASIQPIDQSEARMGSDDELISGNNTNWAAVASIPPLFIQSSLWRLKESQELIKYKLASLGTNLLTWKLNSEARSGELKKSISLLEMVRRESITVMWIYHNQDVCGINQKLFEYHT